MSEWSYKIDKPASKEFLAGNKWVRNWLFGRFP